MSLSKVAAWLAIEAKIRTEMARRKFKELKIAAITDGSNRWKIHN